jgi:uroporphyrinogen III methyltransferase/synthase
VGPVTAAALAAAGVALAVPPAANAAALAAAVLAAGPVAGLRVLVPRAAGGRDEAVAALRAAGAAVDPVDLYRSVTAPATEPAVAAALARLRAGQIEVAIFFAPSQVTALFELLGDQAARLLAGVGLVAAIGPTTRAALVARGVEVAVAPDSPEVAALASRVAERYQGEPLQPASGAGSPRRPTER